MVFENNYLIYRIHLKAIARPSPVRRRAGNVVKPTLRALAVVDGFENFDIQHNEAPELIQLEVHPKFIARGDFHVCLLLFGDDFPAGQGFEFPDEGVVEHKLHPRARHAHFHVADEQVAP